VTIVYPDGVPTFWQFLCGKVARIVVRARRVPIPHELVRGDYAHDAQHRKSLQRWLQELWEDKDRRIDELLPPIALPGATAQLSR
jgi:hypothetical protein